VLPVWFEAKQWKSGKEIASDHQLAIVVTVQVVSCAPRRVIPCKPIQNVRRISCTSASPLGLIELFTYTQALKRKEEFFSSSVVEEHLVSKLGRVLPVGFVSWLFILFVVVVMGMEAHFLGNQPAAIEY